MEQGNPEAIAYDTWADYYDVTDADRSAFIAFYGSLLAPRTRSILELGCGTGTIVSALAGQVEESGQGFGTVRIVGVDGSAGMLRIARERDARIEWILGDMRAPPVNGPFDYIFSCFNTLQHLLDDEDLARAFGALRGLLHPDGIFAFDVYQPNIPHLSIAHSNKLARSIIDDKGRQLEIREDTGYDPGTRVLSLTWRLVERDKIHEPPLAHTHYHLRQYFPADIDRLLASAGLVIRERYGDFDRSPFNVDSKKQILVCGRR